MKINSTKLFFKIWQIFLTVVLSKQLMITSAKFCLHPFRKKLISNSNQQKETQNYTLVEQMI